MAIANEREYWVVGYSDTWKRWQVRKRAVDDTHYTLIEDLGPELLTAALEFDANFVLPDGTNHFEELTEGRPWLFVITTSKKLYAKRVNAPLSDATLLATGVTQVSACRTFKSTGNSVDQGFTVCYTTTEGEVRYRQGRYSDNVWFWDIETTIDGAGAGNTGVQVFRLLDFRVGIYVIGCNKLFISKREYVGNTFKPEYVYAEQEKSFLVLPFRDEALEPTDAFQIISCTLPEPEYLEVQANYPIFDYDSEWEDFYLIGNVPEGQGIDHLVWVDGKLRIYLKIPITSSLAKLTVTIRPQNRKGYFVSEQCKPIWPVVTFGIEPGIISLGRETVHVQTSPFIASFPAVHVQERDVLLGYDVALPEMLIPNLTFNAVHVQERDVLLGKELVIAQLDALDLTFSTTQTGVTPV